MAADLAELAAAITRAKIGTLETPGQTAAEKAIEDYFDQITKEQLSHYRPHSADNKNTEKLIDKLTELQDGLAHFSTFVPLEFVSKIISLSHKIAAENIMLRQKMDELIFKTLKESIRRNISIPNNGSLAPSVLPHMRPDR